MNTFVVIPSYKPRLPKLHRCLDHLQWDREKVVVVAGNNYDERLVPEDLCGKARWYGSSIIDINISTWWTEGMKVAITQGATEILLLNDDCLIKRSGVSRLAEALYEHDLTLTGPNYRKIPEEETIIRTPGPIQWWKRVPGFCMLLRVEDEVWPDHGMRWWLSDDDIEWQARSKRGTGLISGIPISHPSAGGTMLNDVLGGYYSEDIQKFIEKWGSQPCLPA